MLITVHQFTIFLSTFCCLFLQVNSARILGYFPTSSKSHLLIHCAVARTIAEEGHNVTVVAYAPNVYSNASYNYIQIGQLDYDVSRPTQTPAPLENRLWEIFDQLNDRLTHPEMQRFLSENQAGSFDLLILGYYLNNFHLGLAAHFQCPVIVTVTVQSVSITDDLIGNERNVAYVPREMSGLYQPMDFWARLHNCYHFIKSMYGIRYFIHNLMEQKYNENFPQPRYPPYDVVNKNVSMIFANHYFTQGPIRSSVPAYAEIGGIQIKDHVDELPANIGTVLDNSKNGVILVSFGTKILPSKLAAEKKSAMFSVFKNLPYDILWKWDTSEFPGTAANIHYLKWLPQSDVLAHKNLKLFITHGGQGSLIEAQYHGVPLIGIPFMSDQPSNVLNMQKDNFGLSLEYKSLTEQNLNETILEVINNPKYKTTVQKFSILYKDRPMSPKQTVKYWVNYVLRHNGAAHMQSPAVHLSAMQYYLLDIMLFILVITLSIYILIKFIYKISKKIILKYLRNDKKNV